MLRRAALAAITVLSAASFARADSASQWVAKWGEALRNRDFQAADELMKDTAAQEEVSKRPADLLEVTRLAARYFPAGFRPGSNGEGTEKRFDDLAAMAEKVGSTSAPI